jgi:hypothetical protein
MSLINGKVRKYKGRDSEIKEGQKKRLQYFFSISSSLSCSDGSTVRDNCVGIICDL